MPRLVQARRDHKVVDAAFKEGVTDPRLHNSLNWEGFGIALPILAAMRYCIVTSYVQGAS